jgi:hypothetical protein
MALNQATVGPVRYSAGSTGTARLGKDGETVVELNGRLYENAYNGRIFTAGAIVTAPVIFSTAAGTGGPLLWNSSSTVNAVLLKVGIGSSVVTTVAGSLGLTFGVQGPVAPTSTTAIDYAAKSTLCGTGPASVVSIYRIGTVIAAGTTFVPLMQFHTGALTVDTTGVAWIDVEGAFVVPPQSYISLAGSATLSTLVVQTCFVWAEVPV